MTSLPNWGSCSNPICKHADLSYNILKLIRGMGNTFAFLIHSWLWISICWTLKLLWQAIEHSQKLGIEPRWLAFLLCLLSQIVKRILQFLHWSNGRLRTNLIASGSETSAAACLQITQSFHIILSGFMPNPAQQNVRRADITECIETFMVIIICWRHIDYKEWESCNGANRKNATWCTWYESELSAHSFLSHYMTCLQVGLLLIIHEVGKYEQWVYYMATWGKSGGNLLNPCRGTHKRSLWLKCDAIKLFKLSLLL